MGGCRGEDAKLSTPHAVKKILDKHARCDEHGTKDLDKYFNPANMARAAWKSGFTADAGLAGTTRQKTRPAAPRRSRRRWPTATLAEAHGCGFSPGSARRSFARSRRSSSCLRARPASDGLGGRRARKARRPREEGAPPRRSARAFLRTRAAGAAAYEPSAQQESSGAPADGGSVVPAGRAPLSTAAAPRTRARGDGGDLAASLLPPRRRRLGRRIQRRRARARRGRCPSARPLRRAAAWLTAKQRLKRAMSATGPGARRRGDVVVPRRRRARPRRGTSGGRQPCGPRPAFPVAGARRQRPTAARPGGPTR